MSKQKQIEPLGAYILIKPLAAEITTSSAIVLSPTINGEDPEKGEVIAVGPEATNIAKKIIKEGSTVIYKKYAPIEISENEQKYFFVDQTDVVGVIN